jgi:hypothetical protein
MKQITFAIVAIVFGLSGLRAQVLLTEAQPTRTINFSSSMPTEVGWGAYTGIGFSPTNVAGRLNSNAWEVKGFENGDLTFGAAMSNPAHGRGAVASAVITEGIYAYTDNPHSAANPALMIQPGENNFAPGSITLRIRNNGVTNMTQLEVAYDVFVRNDEASSSSFTFSHSNDNLAFVEEPSMDYVSPEEADAFQWVQIDVTPSRSMIITGINVLPGNYYYIRWSSNMVTGSGGSDELGIDNIVVTATYGPPAPEINVRGGGLTILAGDNTPRVADGTEFANTFTGGSQTLKTYHIENLGGAPLTVSDVYLTGPHAADFQIYFVSPTPPPTGVVPAIAGSTVSKRDLTIRFSPTAPGNRTAYINIDSDDANESPYTFMIRGLGVVPQPDIAVYGNNAPNTQIINANTMIPTTVNNTLFGTQVVGGAGELKSYRIRNTGEAALLALMGNPMIQVGGANPADFVVETMPLNSSVAPGFYRDFTIRFNPTASGIRTALITIPNNDVIPDVFGNTEGNFTFLVQGVGVAPEMDVTGNNQPIVDGSTNPSITNHTQFDNQNISSGFQDRVYTIKNSGNYQLTLGPATLTGSTDFTIITQPASAVAPGASTTMTVRFDPVASGMSEATVTIPSNDYNENPYDFRIRGYGLDYIPCTFGAVETIAVQDFEDTPATPVWNYTVSPAPGTVAGGTGYAVNSDGGLTEKFIGAKSLQVSNATKTIAFAAVNTSTYDDVELVLKLSALSNILANGLDATDRVIVGVSTNGSTWSNEIQVTGNADAKWSFASGTGIALKAYDNSSTIFTPSEGGFITTAGFGTLSITGLPKVPNLYIRIVINTDNANEVWAIDDVTLFGRKEILTQWNGSSWSNSAPTPSVKAVIAGPYDTQTQGNLQACKCEILSGGMVTIREGHNFTVQSEINSQGLVTVENGGSVVQKNDLAVNTGTIRVRRYTTPMTRYDYTYWSSPVLGQSLFNLSPLTMSDKYFAFDPVINNWVGVASSSIMVPGKGYIVRAPQDFSLTVPAVYTNGMFMGIPNNGFVNSPILGGAGAWNLIGNPYPSAISADAFIDLPANIPVVNGTLYFWTHNTPITNNVYTDNDYAVYNKTGGTSPAPNNGSGNSSAPTGFIASGQGFFVEAISNGQAVFNNSMRLAGSNMGFFKPVGHASLPAESGKSRAWINLSHDQAGFKQALVGYIDGATDGWDRNYDGVVLEGGNSVSWYSILADKKLSIQGKASPFNDNDIVPMGYSTAMSGLMTVTLENADGDLASATVYLEDKLLNIVHDLTSSSYVFSSDAGTFDYRFQLRFSTEALANPDWDMARGVVVAVNDKTIGIRSYQEEMTQVAVYDLLGRKIAQYDNVNADEVALTDVASAQQSLIVKVTLKSGKVVTQTILY